MSSEHVVHAIECPNGSHHLLEPHLLDCKHILCKTCIDHNTDLKEQIKCPFCPQSTPRARAVPSPIIAHPPQSRGRRHRRARGATYPGVASYACEKAMEDDLLDSSSEEESEFERIRQELDSRRSSDDEDSEEEMEDDKYNFEYVPLKGDKHRKDIPVDTSWDITDVSNKLKKTMEDNDNIIGFYDSYEKDKIYIDIEEGHIAPVEQLIKKEFPDEWRDSRFEIVEQENSPEFFIATGAKICGCGVEESDASQVVQRSIDQHPDKLESDYGTVTCLGVSDNQENYALTAKHVLNKENRTHTAEGRFFSSFNSKITKISEKFLGIMGAFKVHEQEKQVDIAALPLNPDIVHKFDSTMIHRLNDCYRGADDRLEGVKVKKQGASSGFTSGRIISGSYTHRQNRRRAERTVTGSYVVMAPAEGYECFGVGGDSGALIWSTSGIPIGIISQGLRNHNIMGQRLNTVWGVRLDHCLAALHREVNVNIVECRAYGAPLPLATETPQR